MGAVGCYQTYKAPAPRQRAHAALSGTHANKTREARAPEQSARCRTGQNR